MKITCLFLLAVVILTATVTNPGYVPATDTAVVSRTAALYGMHLNNKSAGTVTCVIKDRSTACGGGACPIWGPAPLGASGAAGSVVAWNFNGVPAPNGFTWSCDTASAVVGTMYYQ